jgi:glycosyltransferase involved in cell wall biosynthesis
VSVEKRRVAVFASFSGQGGVEKMLTQLARGFLGAGVRVDLLLARCEGQHLAAMPEGVRIIALNANHTASSLPGLVRYLRREQPPAVLAVKDRAIRVAVLARRLAGVETRLVGRLGTNLGAALAGKSGLQRWLREKPMRRAYRSVDCVVAVSRGVAEDSRRVTGLPTDRIVVIPNPVVSERLLQRAEEPPTHPWSSDGGAPVIVGMGRLTGQKDFPTLLRAFAGLNKKRPCRLLIAGEGRDKDKLQTVAQQLGITAILSLPGFVDNPYPLLKRSALFVLSSAWEGSPNALSEALALGTPVVATDCPSGPREILQDGRYGPLVPVGDHEALAEAMHAALANPLPGDTLREAVREYTVEASARRYLEVLGVVQVTDNR